MQSGASLPGVAIVSSRRADERESGSHEPQPGDSRLAPAAGAL